MALKAKCELQDDAAWFGTHYHDRVPEFSGWQRFELLSLKPVDESREAEALGYQPPPALPGPVTFLKLGKSKTERLARHGVDVTAKRRADARIEVDGARGRVARPSALDYHFRIVPQPRRAKEDEAECMRRPWRRHRFR